MDGSDLRAGINRLQPAARVGLVVEPPGIEPGRRFRGRRF